MSTYSGLVLQDGQLVEVPIVRFLDLGSLQFSGQEQERLDVAYILQRGQWVEIPISYPSPAPQEVVGTELKRAQLMNAIVREMYHIALMSEWQRIVLKVLAGLATLFLVGLIVKFIFGS